MYFYSVRGVELSKIIKNILKIIIKVLINSKPISVLLLKKLDILPFTKLVIYIYTKIIGL